MYRTNLAKWDMNVKRCEPVSAEEKSGIGAKYTCDFEFNGFTTEAEYECTQWEEDAQAQFAANSRMVRTKDTLSFRDAEEGNSTEIEAEFQMFFKGLLFPFTFTLNGPLRSVCPKVMTDMEDFIKKQLSS